MNFIRQMFAGRLVVRSFREYHADLGYRYGARAYKVYSWWPWYWPKRGPEVYFRASRIEAESAAKSFYLHSRRVVMDKLDRG